MNLRVVIVGLLVVVVVGGGGVAWLRWDAVSAFLERAEAQAQVCSTLTDDERLALVGVETPTKLLNVEGVMAEYTCRWSVEDHEKAPPTFVEAASAPAGEWALQMRQTLSTPGLDPRRARRLMSMIAVGSVSDRAGCRFAKAMFEMSGAPKDAKRAVVPSTPATGAPSMLAQSCVQGTYSAVIVVAPDLRLGPALARKTARALRTVEKRLS